MAEPTSRAAAAKARKAAAEQPADTPRDDAMIAALLAERGGYVHRGLTDRVAAVDAQIRAYGGQPPAAPKTTKE